MQILQDDDYKRPRLDALNALNIKRNRHSALEDAYILKIVCNRKPEMFDHPYGYIYGDITFRLNQKLPLPIQQLNVHRIKNWDVYCTSMLRQSQL